MWDKFNGMELFQGLNKAFWILDINTGKIGREHRKYSVQLKRSTFNLEEKYVLSKTYSSLSP